MLLELLFSAALACLALLKSYPWYLGDLRGLVELSDVCKKVTAVMTSVNDQFPES